MSAQTALPAPTGTPGALMGQYPYRDELVGELRALVAGLDPQRIDDRDPQVLDRYERTHAPLRVGVYMPGGARFSVHLGWYPQGEVWRQAAAAVLAHLPGARLVEDSTWAVQWGSRTPGWSPTAVCVVRSTQIAWREPGDLWDTAACAEHCGITASTWRAYRARRDASVPIPLGEALLPGASRPAPVWDRQRVIDWNAARPGKGGRPAH